MLAERRTVAPKVAKAVKVQRVFVVPPEGQTVVDVLRRNGVFPREVGFVNLVGFRNGAALLNVAWRGLRRSEPRSLEYRIHNTPAGYSAEEVAEDVEEATGKLPIKVKIKED